MTNFNVNNGVRVNVAFSFFTGPGGLSRAANSRDATVAIRDTARGAAPGDGTVDGQPVEVVATRRSQTMPSMTLVDIRYPEGAE